jgi:phospholipase C
MSPGDKNVGNLLNAKQISWGWFAGGFRPTVPFDSVHNTPAVCGATHTAHQNVPNTIVNNPTHIDIHTPVADYIPHHEPFQYYASTANPHHLAPSSPSVIGLQGDQTNHQYDLADFFTALNNHTLPAVSFLKAPAFQDGHPGYSDPINEQVFLVDTINQLMQSQEWSDTAIIVAYDDSDGWYDHVMGPIVNPSAASVDALVGAGNCGTPVAGAFEARCGYGPRTPLLAISPFAKENYIDHTVTDQSSILRFIEDNWQLGRIDGMTPVAGQESFDQLAGSLDNVFDFEAQAGRSRKLLLDPATGSP